MEPHLQTFSYRRRNVKLNQFGQVTLFNVAVGQTEGKVHFSSFALHDNNNRVVNRGLAVRLTTLDRLHADRLAREEALAVQELAVVMPPTPLPSTSTV